MRSLRNEFTHHQIRDFSTAGTAIRALRQEFLNREGLVRLLKVVWPVREWGLGQFGSESLSAWSVVVHGWS